MGKTRDASRDEIQGFLEGRPTGREKVGKKNPDEELNHRQEEMRERRMRGKKLAWHF